jgi:peptidoglycan/LPS O-acetylase OafA/YrhL
MILAMGLRITGKILADGTRYYDYIIVLYTQTILAIWIMLAVKFVYQRISDRVNIKLVRKLDGYTMEIYMVHMMFMYMPFCLVGRVNLIIDTVLIILATVISAWILKKAENILTENMHNVQLKIKKN